MPQSRRMFAIGVEGGGATGRLGCTVPSVGGAGAGGSTVALVAAARVLVAVRPASPGDVAGAAAPASVVPGTALDAHPERPAPKAPASTSTRVTTTFVPVVV